MTEKRQRKEQPPPKLFQHLKYIYLFILMSSYCVFLFETLFWYIIHTHNNNNNPPSFLRYWSPSSDGLSPRNTILLKYTIYIVAECKNLLEKTLNGLIASSVERNIRGKNNGNSLTTSSLTTIRFYGDFLSYILCSGGFELFLPSFLFFCQK